MALNQILSIPSSSNGLSPVSGASAWGYGSWIAFTESLPTDGFITGVTFQNQAIPSLDTTQQFLFDVGIGASGAEVMKLQVPYSFRQDTNIGIYMMPVYTIYFPEPYFVPAGSTISVRVADSIASALTYNNTKLTYREADLPTVALNTPADVSTGNDTTPALNFTGTDPDALTIEYDVQIDTANTFDGASTQNVDIAHYSESNENDTRGLYSPMLKIGECFQALACTLTSVKFYVDKEGSPTGNATVCIYNITGTPGTDAIPTGTALATSDTFDVSTLVASPTLTLTTFTFSGGNQISLTNGAYYFVALEYSTGDISNYPSVGINNSSNSGNYAAYVSGVWGANNTRNTCFYVLGTAGGVLIDAKSNVDGGFTTGHPFASAAAKDYTVQSALTAPDTYYWRVRAARNGSNLYGAWSSVRSFNLQTWAAKSLKAYIGGVWTAKPIKTYIGGSWVTKTLKKS